MNRRIILFVLAITLSGNTGSVTGQAPKAVKGVMDLRYLEPPGKFVVRLNGEWEFFWNKMLRPYDFSEQGKYKPDYYGNVPSYWTDYPPEIVKTEKEGYATYRLTVLLPSGLNIPLAFDIPVFDSSYDIYANGNYLGGNGIPGKSKSETTPEYRRNFFRFDPASDSVTIIINVANFDHRRGGFWLPLKLGTFPEMQSRLAADWAKDWAVISLLLGFSLFLLFFFIIYPKDRIIGFFSLATIGLGLRPFFTSHFLILDIVNLNWTWIVRCEYLGLYLVIIGWYWFAVNLYPSKFINIAARINTAIYLLAAIMTLFLPVRIFSNATFLYYPSIIILLGYALYMSFRGIIRKKSIDIAYFFAFILLLAGAYHDIRVSLGRSDTSIGYLLTSIVVVFVFIQAALLLYKWVKAYSEKEKLHNELEFLNRNLERMVNERTQELQKRNQEIEKQNNRIAQQNVRLSETIQLKNKIFALIAHDLRSPVVNILYMLNLLKEEEYKEKYDTFANACIQYAQQVIGLLENMLVWGRGQEDKIRFSPGKQDLANIILTNLSIFKETADKKEIAVNFTQVGNSMAFIDKDLLDIIMRNLLSNAVKYTPRGGRISILLKDKTIDGEGILLKICDNGIGMPAVKQKYLFTSTEMESTQGTENEKGTGIGLKLCHELVRLNNGSISVDSREGEGTCFSILLPV